jgi:hypothetical protein
MLAYSTLPPLNVVVNENNIITVFDLEKKNVFDFEKLIHIGNT